MLRFHTQTAGCSLTAQQPYNNIVRVAVQALAAVLGGTQSLHTNSLDETLALPTEHAARIALRTQQIIAHESGVTNSVDPLGGSYLVETMTTEMELRALAIIAEIDALGGIVSAIEQGYVQRRIADSAYAYEQAVAEQSKIIVGVNAYRSDQQPQIPFLQMDPEGEGRHLERLRRVRAERDQADWSAALARLERAAENGENTMPALIGAANAYATVGEITNCLRGVLGEHRALVIV
jgi:methylmalonyl-CoA mutase N-terminal domain/subunit